MADSLKMAVVILSLFATLSFSVLTVVADDRAATEPEKKPKGLPHALPDDPSRIERKGGFSVWALPKGDIHYTIIVQIDLPPDTAVLSRDDLLGSHLEGPHKYKMKLPHQTTTIVVAEGKAQFAVLVPGNPEAIQGKDLLTLKSKLLKQTQTFKVGRP